VLCALNTSAQNNAIFFGGSGDGAHHGSFLQTMTEIYRGGVGDGASANHYAQPVAPIFFGGSGDGVHYGSFLQTMTEIYRGGDGDGVSANHYVQPVASIFFGGTGDGFAHLSFAESFTEIRKGGVGDGWASNVLPLQPLPLNLLSFTGISVHGTHILNWETSDEINTALFEIEYASGMPSAFYKIGEIAAFGSMHNRYAYTYSHPLPGNNFYRLKMMDLDGSFTYSNVVLLYVLNDKTTVLIFPNPTATKLQVSFGNVPEGTPLKLFVFDATGKIISQLNKVHNNIPISIDVSNIPSGIYFLKIVQNGITETIQFNKVNRP
jgi:hypothetical protein